MKISHKRIDPIGLGIFRAAFFLVLFFEVSQLYEFRELIYGPLGNVVPNDVDFSLALKGWMAVCIMLSIGCFTRINTILNYAFTIVFISTIRNFEYHMFYVYVGVNFLVMFMPISKAFSLDAWFSKLIYGENFKNNDNASNLVSVWHYWLLLLFGVAFAYFGSCFYKFDSYLWMNGLGFWLPSSLPMASDSNFSFMLNNKPLSIFLGYFTLVFEFAFIFIFWFKKFRIPLLLIGLGLHIGIVFVYPIPWFGYGMSAILLLLAPTSLWRWLGSLFGKSRYTIYYQNDFLTKSKEVSTLRTFDIFGRINFVTIDEIPQGSLINSEPKKTDGNISYFGQLSDDPKKRSGVDFFRQYMRSTGYLLPLSWLFRLNVIKNLYTKYGTKLKKFLRIDHHYNFGTETLSHYLRRVFSKTMWLVGTLGIVYLLILQFAVIYKTPFMTTCKKSIGIANTQFDKKLIKSARSLLIKSKAKQLYGITDHPLFMDGHFRNYNHIIAVSYDNKGEDIWLPIIDEEGNPSDYLLGPIWANWTFRTNGPRVHMTRLRQGLRRYTTFWSKQNNINLARGKGVKFNVWVKKIDVPKEWSYDYKANMESREWVSAGEVIWNRGKITYNLVNIEKL